MPRPIKTELYKFTLCIYDVLMLFYQDATSDNAKFFAKELIETGLATRRVSSKRPELKRFNWKLAYVVNGIYFYRFASHRPNYDSVIKALKKVDVEFKVYRDDKTY